MLDDNMWAAYPLGTQIQNLPTTSHEAKFLFDGKTVKMNAYIFSTDDIPSVAYDATHPPANTPQYGGSQKFVAVPLSWSMQISVAKNCFASFITLIEKASDPNAQISST
jgi:hypothetical protein